MSLILSLFFGLGDEEGYNRCKQRLLTSVVFVAQDTPWRSIDIFLIDLGSMCVVCFEP